MFDPSASGYLARSQRKKRALRHRGGRRPRRDGLEAHGGQIVADARDFLELERGKGGMMSESVTRGRY